MNKSLIVVLFAPSAGGKDSVINALHQQGIAYPCVRETTRPLRQGDNGFYRFVSDADYRIRQSSCQYLFDHEYCGHGYSVPISDLKDLLDSSRVPILKGEINQIEIDREKIRCLWPEVKMITIELIPNPLAEWLRIIRLERYDNVEARIADGISELNKAQNGQGKLIDFLVENKFGELDRTIELVKSLILV